jgi:hypothetical protein
MFPIPRSIRSDLLTLSHVSRDHTDQSGRTSSSNSAMTDAKASGLALLTCRRSGTESLRLYCETGADTPYAA